MLLVAAVGKAGVDRCTWKKNIYYKLCERSHALTNIWPYSIKLKQSRLLAVCSKNKNRPLTEPKLVLHSVSCIDTFSRIIPNIWFVKVTTAKLALWNINATDSAQMIISKPTVGKIDKALIVSWLNHRWWQSTFISKLSSGRNRSVVFLYRNPVVGHNLPGKYVSMCLFWCARPEYHNASLLLPHAVLK